MEYIVDEGKRSAKVELNQKLEQQVNNIGQLHSHLIQNLSYPLLNTFESGISKSGDRVSGQLVVIGNKLSEISSDLQRLQYILKDLEIGEWRDD